LNGLFSSSLFNLVGALALEANQHVFLWQRGLGLPEVLVLVQAAADSLTQNSRSNS
jgi:hypothetical protein